MSFQLDKFFFFFCSMVKLAGFVFLFVFYRCKVSCVACDVFLRLQEDGLGVCEMFS